MRFCLVIKMKCKLCKCKLGDRNESGYCRKCFYKSPQYLEYQRVYQREKCYKSDKRQRWLKKYKEKNKVKMKKYMKKYYKDNDDII